jgi:hypothetical protein
MGRWKRTPSAVNSCEITHRLETCQLLRVFDAAPYADVHQGFVGSVDTGGIAEIAPQGPYRLFKRRLAVDQSPATSAALSSSKKPIGTRITGQSILPSLLAAEVCVDRRRTFTPMQ